MTGRVLTIAWLALGVATSTLAQVGTPDAGVLTDPIRCWWRSSTGAVRIAEPFDVLLTCAVLETDSITAAPDQTGLEPTVVQLPPFEVLGGDHPTDLHADDRRFFQYRYALRLIADDAFGRDVALPPLAIGYRIRSRGPQGAALEGRDQTYLLPPLSIRVLALVPDELRDIRDSGGGSFADLEARELRGRILLVLGALLTLLGVIVAWVGAVRWRSRGVDRARTPPTLLSDGAVLRGVTRELTSIRLERQGQGWTPALAGRALSASRIVAAVAVSGRVSQSPAVAGVDRGDGQLVLQGGWWPRRSASVSGWETPETVRQELARRVSPADHESDRPRLEPLHDALVCFTQARYGRDRALDEAPLDSALQTSTAIAGHLEYEHRWPVTKYRAVARFITAQRNRLWSR